MDEQRAYLKWPIRLVRLAVKAVVGTALVLAALLLAQAFADRRLGDLERWQSDPPEGEFRAADAALHRNFTFADYLKIEDRLFQQLDGYMISPGDLAGRSPILRYVRGGRSDPSTFSPNWNRTTELEPTGEPKAGVLLLHGLSDSPYSMRSLAEMFQSQGCYALCLRLPGHGTVPGGLLDVTWDDWLAATRVGVARVRERVGPDKPLYICGYSNGGALATLYTIEAVNDGGKTDPIPTRVFLFSPAIGVTEFARASNWHKLYSWIPYFEKSKWLSIEPEYDPFKYCSFTKNAGKQVWTVTKRIRSALDRAAADGSLAKLPPIMAFQSNVDATVIAGELVTGLFNRLPANGSEIVVFDVNRASMLNGLYRKSFEALDALKNDQSRAFAVTIIENADADSGKVVARRRAASTSAGAAVALESLPLDTPWPREVYSLAHVAIPFPPDDPVYGETPPSPTDHHIRLGDLSLRGEKNVLRVSGADMLRLRHNPFHAYMLTRMREAMTAK